MKNVKNALAKSVSGSSLPWAMWIWNRTITVSEIEKQLNELISHGFGGIAVRPGRDMFPAYMSQEFLDNFRLVLQIARQHKVTVRLADDLSVIWKGGLDSIIDQSRKLRAEYLVLEREVCETDADFDLDPEFEYIAQAVKIPAKGSQTVDVKQITLPPAGKGVFHWKAPSSDWRLMIYRKEPVAGPAGCGVPNVLNPKVIQLYTQNFLEVLKTACTEFSPTTFEGFILEMPALRPGGNAIYWDEDIAVKYKSRYKREFMPMLPHLFTALPGAERVRAHLHRFIYDLMIERFALALDQWAKKFRLSQWVLWPEAGIYKPENAQVDGYIPTETAISTMGLQNLDGSLENFAILRTVADTNSNQHRRDTVTVVGRNRLASGSGLQELKREIDLSLLAGPSRILVDGFYFNTEQRNCYKSPYNTVTHAPDGEYMKLLCAYSARTQELMAGAQRPREVAVLTPYDAAMGDYMPGNSAAATEGMARYKRAVDALCCFGKAFDVVTEDFLLSCMVRQDGAFGTADRIRKGNYQALVIPYAPYISRRLLVHLEKLAIKGTPLVFVDEAPLGTFEDGGTASVVSRIQKLVAPRRENVSVVSAADIDQALAGIKPEVTLMRESGESADIGVQVYHGENGRIHIFHNVSDTAEQSVIAELQNEKFFTAIDGVTGETIELEPMEVEKNIARLRLSFSPLQTIIIAATANKISGGHAADDWNPFTLPPRSYRIIFKDQWDFEPLSPNVLPLSNWNVRMGLSRESGQISHFYEATFEIKELPAGNCVFIMNGMSRSNAPFQNLEISFNGIRVEGEPATGEYAPWRESVAVKLFGDKSPCFEIGDKMIKGLNRLSIRTTGSAIEQQTLAYPPLIVGVFSIVKGAHGLAIDKPAITAAHDSWTKHGYPYMSGCARYGQTFEVPNDYDKLVLRFSNVSGTVRVNINDIDVGILHWPPMELDVTKYCNVQRNRLTVEVVNTPDNVLRLSGKPSGLRGEVYIDVYKS